MSWNPLIPQPGDLISVSQSDILGNFQALDPIVNGIQNSIKLTEQAVSPATAANQMALFTKDVAGATAMFLRKEGNGSEVDFTTSTLAATGACTLPCGLKMKWGSGTLNNGSVSTPVAFAVNFTTLFTVMLTAKQPGGVGDPRDYILRVTNELNTGFTVIRDTSYKGTSAPFYWLALGI